MLLALSSLLGAPGGIPAFNRLLVRAAAEFAQKRQEPLDVVVLTDDPCGPNAFADAFPKAVRATYAAFGGNRALFAGLVLRHRRRHSVAVLGHVNLSPLGLCFRRFGVIAHGTDVWSPLPMARRLALRRATVVGGVSEDTLSKVVFVQGVDRSRCQRLINALDEDNLERASRASTVVSTADALSLSVGQTDGLRMAAISRLWKDEPKGIDLLLHGLVHLSHARLEIVGEGAARPQLEALARAFGVAERVHFAGCLSEEEKHAVLARSDVFALPSSGEGFGIVYLEAMAHSLPCLAARPGGAKEVVLDGETGFVVEPQVESIVSGLRRLEDGAVRARLGLAGRRRLLAEYTYPAFVRHLDAFFARLVPT